MVPIPDPVTMMKLKKFDDSLGNPSRKMASFNENLLQKANKLVNDTQDVARQKLMAAAASGTTPVSTTTTTTTPVTLIVFLGVVLLIGGAWFLFSRSKNQGTQGASSENEEESASKTSKVKKAIGVVLFIVIGGLLYKCFHKSSSRSQTSLVNGQSIQEFCLNNPAQCTYTLK